MASKSMSMLIVDDELGILQMLKEVFEARNWRVFAVPTGMAAFGLLEKEDIDIMLLDLRLPDKPGMEILEEVKKLYPALPVIIMTGLGYQGDLVAKAMRLGAAGYVTKGLSLKEIIDTIANTLTTSEE